MKYADQVCYLNPIAPGARIFPRHRTSRVGQNVLPTGSAKTAEQQGRMHLVFWICPVYSC